MIEPKPFITRADYFKLNESDRPKTGMCDKHGEFEIKRDESLPIKIIMATCPKCSAEYAEHLKKQKELEDKKSEEECYKRKLSGYGVTNRHYGKTFDAFIADTKDKKLALDTCRYLADMIISGVCKNVIMVGSVGTGKTHLANAICHRLAEEERHIKVRMETVTEIIRHYRSSYNKDSGVTEQGAIDYYSGRDLLIIDELGTSKGDDKELNILFEIINNRYESKLPTVIISNLSMPEVKETLGQRIIDRLKEDGCRVLGMQWESHRESHKSDF